MNIDETSIGAQAEIALFTTKTYKKDGNIGISRKKQVSDLVHLDAIAGPRHVSKSIVPPSIRD